MLIFLDNAIIFMKDWKVRMKISANNITYKLIGIVHDKSGQFLWLISHVLGGVRWHTY